MVVQTNTGELFAVRPSGRTREIDLGGADVASGDGVLVIDHVAYVVQNFLNTVAKVRLSDDLSSGRVVSRTGDPDFDVPIPIDTYRGALYLVNARFHDDARARHAVLDRANPDALTGPTDTRRRRHDVRTVAVPMTATPARSPARAAIGRGRGAQRERASTGRSARRRIMKDVRAPGSRVRGR